MADFAADIKTYRPNADDVAIEGLVKTYRLVMSDRDSSSVAYTDKEELATVKDNFLKKKLGLTDSDEVLDAAIAAIGEELKGVNTKYRTTVYYLLAEKFAKLDIFK